MASCGDNDMICLPRRLFGQFLRKNYDGKYLIDVVRECHLKKGQANQVSARGLLSVCLSLMSSD